MKDLYVPYKLRLALYVIGFVGTPVVMALVAQGLLPKEMIAIWAAYCTGVSGLAAVNVTPEYK